MGAGEGKKGGSYQSGDSSLQVSILKTLIPHDLLYLHCEHSDDIHRCRSSLFSSPPIHDARAQEQEDNM